VPASTGEQATKEDPGDRKVVTTSLLGSCNRLCSPGRGPDRPLEIFWAPLDVCLSTVRRLWTSLVLQVALRIFTVLLAFGGFLMIFPSRALVVRVFLHPPEAEISTLLLFLLKETGGIVLMVSAMLFLASRGC